MDHPSPTIVQGRGDTCLVLECRSRVPCYLRQQYLDCFVDECLNFCKTEDEAYQMALKEEKRAFNKSSNKKVYFDAVGNILKKLQHRVPHTDLGANIKNPSSIPKNEILSNCHTLGGRKCQETSAALKKEKYVKSEESDLAGIKFYNMLKEFILTEDQLDSNGFPRQHPSHHGKAVIINPRKKNKISNNPLERRCCRCNRKYFVTENGNYVREEKCHYHNGRLYTHITIDDIESEYTCCQQDSEAQGCCVAQGHVFQDNNYDNLKGYVKTLNKPSKGSNGIYSLDCEMCYTTAGMELIKVSVITPDLQTIYETLVKPDNPVLEYNTRFSGVTEIDMKGITTTLRDVQGVLLSLFNSKTIIIGHSLECDFKALKLIHRTVVDTSVVFPHRRAPSFKLALRTLAAKYLQKTIQNNENGHDSQEDALTCMELMLWKTKQTSRMDNRKELIPCDVRQQYLKSFLEEYLKLCKTEDEAYEMFSKEHVVDVRKNILLQKKATMYRKRNVFITVVDYINTCYTTAGLELIRVTILASDMEPVYETLVKPDNPILDYSTKFSDVTEQDMAGISTTISDVQAVLLSLFNSKTILIGHSLGNDFKVLKLLHGTVVDTSVVFPHTSGPSFKLALRTLAKKYLNKTIQNSENGHDSQDDASTCMELMIWNIKEDIRTTNGWINRYSLEN